MTALLVALWPYLLVVAVVFGLPLLYIALEVAAAPLYGPDEQPLPEPKDGDPR